MREEKAITLVSLVVTIIVLILLAGVSINLVIGDNGIIKTAQKSKQNVQDMITDKQTKLNEIYTQEEERQENTAAEELIKLKQFKVKMAEAINDLTQSKTNLDVDSETEEFEETIENMLYTLTEDADAQASDIAQGKTAYVDGKLVDGTGSLTAGRMNVITAVKKKNNSTILNYTFDRDYKGIMISSFGTRDNGTGYNIHFYLNDEKIISSNDVVAIPENTEIPENETYADIYNAVTLATTIQATEDDVLYYRVICIPVYNIKAGDVIKITSGTNDRTYGSATVWSFE